jgi:hypothetical protein
VKVRVRPVGGGTASVLGADSATGHYAEADGDGVLIAAVPATGYRFVGWQLHGAKIATLRAATQRRAQVVPRKSGGVTATASFARIHPRHVVLTRLGDDSADLWIDRAPLAAGYTGPSPLAGGADVTLMIGDLAYPVSAGAWKRAGGGVYVASFRPSAWRHSGDRVQLTLDTRADRWSVRIEGADAADELLRDAAAGQLRVALEAGASLLGHESVPVAGSALLGQRKAPQRAAEVVPSAVRIPIDLRAAALRSVLDPSDYRKARLYLTDVKVESGLLRRAGFDLSLNGLSARIGAATLRNGVFSARGRTTAGVWITCRWTRSGVLSLTLQGGYLERELSGCVAQNLTLTIGSGTAAKTGNMMPVVRRLSTLAVVPRLAD